MHPTVIDRLEMRERARALGDTNLERACNADLARYGYRDEFVRGLQETAGEGGPETTTAEALPERAVPEKPKRGRPPRPRCEHGRIVGRCIECDEEE